MTREGIAFILDKYVSKARSASSLVPEKVTPHVLRQYVDRLHMGSVTKERLCKAILP